mmetsp:Transcript_42191/g.108719  ORF Transcript_42191/g.108719 Transcript_42191/m.108719 type:complete len:304 (-) Transcript_42191:38-949(-)
MAPIMGRPLLFGFHQLCAERERSALGFVLPLLLLLAEPRVQSAASEAECRSYPIRGAAFGGGGAGPTPWWGAGLGPGQETGAADRSLGATLSSLDSSGIGLDGPSLWGSGMDLGPASMDDHSAAAAEWRTGVSPEHSRFSRLGAGGLPTSAGRRLALELSSGLACRACQHMLNEMWANLTEPSNLSMRRWLSNGCVDLVRRHQFRKGWQVTSEGCDGAGYRTADGTVWCFLQDVLAEVVRKPDLAQEYDPAKDALFLACERTLGANLDRVVAFLLKQRQGTWAMQRNERFTGSACAQAACCDA